MMSLSGDTQAGVIEALNSTSRYLDDLLYIDNPYFEGMVSQIYPVELQLNKAKFPIRRPRFRYTFINFRQILDRCQTMTNAVILISTLLNFHF